MERQTAGRGRTLALVVLLVTVSTVATGIVVLPGTMPARPARAERPSGPGSAPLPLSLGPEAAATVDGAGLGLGSGVISGGPPTVAGASFPATISPPNPDRPHLSGSGLVSMPFRAAPAPIGLSDLGVGPAGAYSYGTTRFEGNITVDSFSAFTPTNVTDAGYAAPDWALLQLNTVLGNVSSLGSSDGTFWIQNLVHLNGTTLQFEDNVWNFTSMSRLLPTSTLYGTIGRNPDLTVYAGIVPAIPVTLPFTLGLVSSTFSAADGHTVVTFDYSLLDKGTLTSKVYDTVTFNGSERAGPPQFVVNGSSLNKAGYLDDAEFVLGGNGGASNANLVSLNATARLLRWDASVGEYRAVPSAYDFGADSAETALGVAVSYTGSTAHLSQGPSFLEGLWNTTNNSIARHARPGSVSVHLEVDPSYAFGFATNLSRADGRLALANYSYAPSSRSGNLTTILPPNSTGEPYVFRFWADGFASQSLNVSGSTAQPVTVSLVPSHSTLDAPVYLLGTGQGSRFGKAKVTGTGFAPGSDMLWLNATPTHDDLAAPFLRTNDFNDTTFQLVATAGLNLSLTANGFAQAPASFNYTNPLGRVTELPYRSQGYFFYHGSGHFSVQNTSVVGSAQLAHLPIPEYPLGTVQFLGTSDVAAGNVTASDDAIGVRLFDATTAHVAHLTVSAGAVGLTSYGSSDLWFSRSAASGSDAYARHSVLVELNHTSTVTATALSVSSFGIGLRSAYSSAVSLSGLTVTGGALGLEANWTNASTVTGLTLGPSSTAGTWQNSADVVFKDVSSRSSGLNLLDDPSVKVEDGFATGANANVVNNTTGSDNGAYSDIRANDSATGLILEHGGTVSAQAITATNGSTGVVVQDVSSFTGDGITSSGESVGAYVNDTVGAVLTQVTVSSLSIGVFGTNSTHLTVSDVTATNATLGKVWNFTNASRFTFPVAAVGLSHVTGADITAVSARDYPFGVWSFNSTAVDVRDLVSLYGGQAINFTGTNYSNISHAFAFGDQLGIVLAYCNHTSVKESTLELSTHVGIYVDNGSIIYVTHNSFVANNGSGVTGVFNVATDQAYSNCTAPRFHANFWADHPKGSTKGYLIGPANASLHDTGPVAAPPNSSLEFKEQGLPVGDFWDLTVAGVTYATNVSLLVIPGWNLTPRALPFSVGLVAGYPANPSSGSVPWVATNATVTIVFGAVRSSTPSPPIWIYAAAGGGAAVAAVALVLLLRRRGRSRPPAPMPRRPAPAVPSRPAARPVSRPPSRPPARRSSDEWSPDDLR